MGVGIRASQPPLRPERAEKTGRTAVPRGTPRDSSPTFAKWGNSGLRHNRALGISRTRSTSCTSNMEGSNGALCLTRRVVEGDGDFVVDQTGKIVCEKTVASNPEAIAAYVTSKAPGSVRIGLLWTELKRLGLPVICIDADTPKRCSRCRSTRRRHRAHHADWLVQGGPRQKLK